MKTKLKEENSFQKACQFIVEQVENLSLTFNQADSIIGNKLNSNIFSRDDLLEQLEILANKEFASVITFCLSKGYPLFRNPKIREEIQNDELYSFLKYIVAKYSTQYKRKMQIEFNPNGWRNVRHFIVNWNDQWNPNYLIEYHIELNDFSKFVIREDADDVLQLISIMVDGIIEAEHNKSSVAPDSLDEVINKLISLKKE